MNSNTSIMTEQHDPERCVFCLRERGRFSEATKLAMEEPTTRNYPAFRQHSTEARRKAKLWGWVSIVLNSIGFVTNYAIALFAPDANVPWHTFLALLCLIMGTHSLWQMVKDT